MTNPPPPLVERHTPESLRAQARLLGLRAPISKIVMDSVRALEDAAAEIERMERARDELMKAANDAIGMLPDAERCCTNPIWSVLNDAIGDVQEVAPRAALARKEAGGE